jgi:mannosyltransferase
LFACILIALVAVGGWLRFSGLPQRDLWLDENCTFYAVHRLFDWPADGPDPRRELAHIPYFATLHLWTRLTGESPWGLRSFSAMCGTVLVAVMGLVGARLLGRGAGLVAAALTAVSPIAVYYGQEARVYSLWLVSMAATIGVLHHAGIGGRRRWWAAFVVLALLDVLLHYSALLWIPASICVALASPDRRRCVRQWVGSTVILIVLLIPVVAFLVLPMREGGPRGWLRETWRGYPPALAIPRSLWAMLPSGDYPEYLGRLHDGVEEAGALFGWGGGGQEEPFPHGRGSERSDRAGLVGEFVYWGPALAVGALVVGLIPRRRGEPAVRQGSRGREGSGTAAVMVFLSGMTLMFLLTAWVYAAFAGGGYVVGRYDLPAWPGVTLLLAALASPCGRPRRASVRVGRDHAESGGPGGGGPLPSGRGSKCNRSPVSVSAYIARVISAVVVSTWILASGVTLAGMWRLPVDTDTGRRADRIAQLIDRDDLVVSVGLYRWFMTYAWHEREFEAEVMSFPPWHDRQMCWEDAEAEVAQPERLDGAIRDTVGRVREALAQGRRVWLLATGDPVGPRWEVDRWFYQQVRAAGIDIDLTDDWVGLARLRGASTTAPQP